MEKLKDFLFLTVVFIVASVTFPLVYCRLVFEIFFGRRRNDGHLL